MKKTIFLALISPLFLFGQENNRLLEFTQLSLSDDGSVGKYGLDTMKCEENLSIYTEFYKQKSYQSALDAWLYLFVNAPQRTKNIYTHGATMFKSFIKNEKDSLKKEGLIDDLLTIYDARNYYYPGQEGLVLGYKGSDLYRYRKSNLLSVQEAYSILSKSLDLDKEKSTARALNYYFASGAKLTSKKMLTKEELIDLFSQVSDIIEYKEAQINQTNFDLNEKESLTSKEKKVLKKNNSELKTLNDVRANMEKTLAPHVTCEKLEVLYQPSFDINKEDDSWLQRAAHLLRKKDCIDTDIYFQIAAQQYELNPTPKSAFNMGARSLKKNNYDKALEYFSQAVDGETDNIKKADYLFYIAKTYYAMGSRQNAKKHAIQASQYRLGWGAPYILIGDLYATTSRECGENTGKESDEFTKRVGYWAAIEKYQYAKKIDPSSLKEANQKIELYTKQMPDKTMTFNTITLQQATYKIDCWYSEVVQNPWFSN